VTFFFLAKGEIIRWRGHYSLVKNVQGDIIYSNTIFDVMVQTISTVCIKHPALCVCIKAGEDVRWERM